MNVHISYKVPKTSDLEQEISHHIDKLQTRLRVFRPELVHLKGIVEHNSTREGTHVSLNLRLPSGQLAAQESAPNDTAAVKIAFDELTRQLTRHKDLLRSSHKWRRDKRSTLDSRDVGVPFEQTVAAVLPPKISADDVRSYVDVNLSRLQRFVARELYFRRISEDPPANHLSTNEVVDEAIAQALSDTDPPEKVALEPWLYHLALKAMNEMSAKENDLDSAIHLEDPGRPQNIEASDEASWQFQQPDEKLTKENSIPDRRVSTPEQAAYSDEMIALVQSALRGADRSDREAFLLYGIEGFSLSEIAVITGRPAESIRESIERARMQVRSAPSVANEFPRELINRIAI